MRSPNEPVYKRRFYPKCTLVIRSPDDQKREWTYGQLECKDPALKKWQFKKVWMGGSTCPDAKIDPVEGDLVADVRILNQDAPQL